MSGVRPPVWCSPRVRGVGAGLTDADYQAAGGEIVADADQVFARAELIVKVKEPLAVERKKLRRPCGSLAWIRPFQAAQTGR
jgi:alanine dehydrogenase